MNGIFSWLKTTLRRTLFEGQVVKLMGVTIINKPVGLVTQMLIASYFGAGTAYDAYALGFNLVNFAQGIIGKVYAAAVIPLTIAYRQSQDRRATQAFQNASLLLFQGCAMAFLLGIVLGARPIVDTLFSKLPPETAGDTVRMLRLIAVPGVFLVLTSLLRTIHNLNGRYLLAGSMPLVNGLIILASIVFLHETLGIWSLVGGLLASSVIQTVILSWNSLREGLLALVRPSFPEGSLSRLWHLASAVLLAQTLLTANAFIDKAFAASLEAGSISSITYANTLVNLVVQLFATSVTVVMFTRMSELLAAREYDRCGRYIDSNLQKQLLLVMPVCLVFFTASEEIVALLFQQGAFDRADTERTALALRFYTLGLPAVTLNATIARVFHALQKMRARIWLALQFLVTCVVGNILLVKPLGVQGLAISMSASITLHIALSMLILRRYELGLGVPRISANLLRDYLAAGAALALLLILGPVELPLGELPVKAAAAAGIAVKAGAVALAWGPIYLASRWVTGRLAGKSDAG